MFCLELNIKVSFSLGLFELQLVLVCCNLGFRKCEIQNISKGFHHLTPLGGLQQPPDPQLFTLTSLGQQTHNKYMGFCGKMACFSLKIMFF